MPTDPLLTIDEVAALLNTPLSTARYLAKTGVLPVVKLGPKAKSRIRIKRSDVDAFIESGYKPATTGPLAR